MAKKLKITLLPNGQIQMKTIGVKGKSCTKYAKMIEELADAKIVEQHFTEEYYQQDNENIMLEQEQIRE